MKDAESTHSLSARWLFVSDVDDTLLGNDAALQTLGKALAAAGGTLAIAYNSSRPCASLIRSLDQHKYLAVPDYLIGALGTEIQNGRTGQPLVEYGEYVDHRWDRTRVSELAIELGFVPHSTEFQTPLKASFDVPGPAAYHSVVRRLADEAIEAKVIFSGAKNLDVIPARAGKGSAIQFLAQQLAIDPSRIVVAGDSGNDLEMFVAPRKGIVVANADEELKRLQGDHVYLASAAYAAGVLEGLRYWGVLQ